MSYQSSTPLHLNELITEITKRTGISEDQAKSTIAMVMDSLKTNLPDELAEQMDRVLTGSAFSYQEVLADKLADAKAIAEAKLKQVQKGAQGLIDKIL
jgi:hypothetical protein